MSNKPYVIVGAGHAARRAAETLREKAPDAAIVMIGDELSIPYDRPVLSKDALLGAAGESKAFLRDAAWYRSAAIDLRLGVRVERIDRTQQTVALSDGSKLAYDRLLLATGSRIRPFPGPVDDAVKLHYVRTIDDARALRAVMLSGKKMVVIGGGFIGLEVAASARSIGCDVTVVEGADRLLRRGLPEAVGRYMQALHVDHGVQFRLATQITGIRTVAPGRAVIETRQGDLEADIVVVGIGVLPNVELAAAAGLEVSNGIVVDESCATADPAVFAAGEVTAHFNPTIGRHLRIESWQVAENQPVVAAAGMLGERAIYAEVPWLWSDQYDCNIQTLGLFDDNQQTVLRGDPASGVFSVLALDSRSRLTAVAAVRSGRDVSICRRLMQADRPLDAAVLADMSVPLRSHL